MGIKKFVLKLFNTKNAIGRIKKRARRSCITDEFLDELEGVLEERRKLLDAQERAEHNDKNRNTD